MVCCCRKAAVCDEDMLDFLKGIVEGIPDLGPEEEAPPPDTKPKRRRYIEAIATFCHCCHIKDGWCHCCHIERWMASSCMMLIRFRGS